MIFDHDHYKYREKWNMSGYNKYNGAFYYSKEIVKNCNKNIIYDDNLILDGLKYIYERNVNN